MREYLVSIFKVLFMLIILPPLLFGIVEYINVHTNSYKLTPLLDISVDQAAKMFSEESFLMSDVKSEFPDLSGTVRQGYASDTYREGAPLTHDIRALLSIQNQLFGNKRTIDEIYNYLMYNSPTSISDFGNSVSNVYEADGITRASKPPKEIFTNLGRILDTSDPIGAVYRDAHATPMNLGIPYLDVGTVTAMAKWNMANVLSMDNRLRRSGVSGPLVTTELTNMHRDDTGKIYIMWNGYRVYIDDLKLDVKYRLLNLSSGSADYDQFEAMTHMDAKKLFGYDAIVSGANEKYFIIAEVTYTVPFQYEGITPWRRAMSWFLSGAFTSSVSGSDGATAKNAGLDRGAEDQYIYTAKEGAHVGGAEGFADDMSDNVLGDSTNVYDDGGFDFSYAKTERDIPKLVGTVKHYIVK